MAPLLRLSISREHRPVEIGPIPDTPVRKAHSTATFVPRE